MNPSVIAGVASGGGGGGGGGPALPTTDLLLDIDPALGVTTSGGRVTQLVDQAGGVAFTVPGAGSPSGPTYVSSHAPLGGQPALLYGTSLYEILTASGFGSVSSDWTAYVACDAGTTETRMRALDREDSTNRLVLYPKFGTVVRAFDGSFRTFAAPTTGPQALTYRFTSLGSEAWRGAASPASLGTAGSSGEAWSGTIAIGGDSNSATKNEQMDGHVGRILVYEAAHDASQRAAVWAYLASIYGV